MSLSFSILFEVFTTQNVSWLIKNIIWTIHNQNSHCQNYLYVNSKYHVMHNTIKVMDIVLSTFRDDTCIVLFK